MSLMISFIASGSLANMSATIGVLIVPGHTALMQIPLEAYSSAALFVSRRGWNVNRTSGPGLGANECVPSGKWCFAIREANVSFGETDLQDLGSPLHGIPPLFG